MNVYFSGIGGSGISSLAHIALDSGLAVFGSDSQSNSSVQSLIARGATITIEQNFNEIQQIHQSHPIDWIVRTAGLPVNHPHIYFAKQNKIKITKRDEFINWIIIKNNLKLIAVAGTHGKTTTTGMLVWIFKQLKLPVSYLIGSQVSFGQSGAYEKDSKFFVLECDEFDKNFLKYNPFGTIITTIDFDHPDIYKNIQDYRNAFAQYFSKVTQVGVAYKDHLLKAKLLKQFNRLPIHLSINSKEIDLLAKGNLSLAGLHNRQNAMLAVLMMDQIIDDIQIQNSSQISTKIEYLISLVNTFPGTYRRFEKITNNVFSDYAHHPDEIKATLNMAKELQNQRLNFDK